MRIRVQSALAYATVLLGLAGLGGAAWAAFVCLLGLVGVREGAALLDLGSHRSARFAPAAGALTLPFLWLLPDGEHLVLPVLLGCAMLAGAVELRAPLVRRSSGEWAAGLALLLAVALPLSYLVALRQLPGPPWPDRPALGWLFLVLVLVWANDSAAYLVGRAWGRRPFFPSISPNKTWEGALGGLLGSALLSVGLAWAAVPGTDLPPAAPLGLGPGAALVLGVCVALAGTFGDLVESFLKRRAGVKDSGSLIPGHGGILDRVDSLLWAAPLGYYLARWLAGGA